MYRNSFLWRLWMSRSSTINFFNGSTFPVTWYTIPISYNGIVSITVVDNDQLWIKFQLIFVAAEKQHEINILYFDAAWILLLKIDSSLYGLSVFIVRWRFLNAKRYCNIIVHVRLTVSLRELVDNVCVATYRMI